MPINKLFSGVVDLTGKALDLRMERQGIIQSNIANMETPGYTEKELPFAQVLDRVQEGQEELVRTNPRHLPGESVASTSIEDTGRPVDLDEEMVKLSENQLMYRVATRVLSKKFADLQYAIDQGGK